MNFTFEIDSKPLFKNLINVQLHFTQTIINQKKIYNSSIHYL
jgi:hypothetical protein